MNEIVRRAIREGLDPVEAIQMVTINPATYFGLEGRGVVAPGAVADLAVIRDLAEMTVEAVFIGGELVASEGELLINMPPYIYPQELKNSVKLRPIKEEDLAVRAAGSEVTGRAIVCKADQNLTETMEVNLLVADSIVQADVNRDILYMACLERYGRNGNIGKCFVNGLGLRQGAIAESVAHDTHNILVAGTNLKDMVTAVNRVIELGGGIVAVQNSRVLADLRLPVGGLITDELTGLEVSQRIENLERVVRDHLGAPIHAPFMHLSFLALSTSPKWKLTDRGLIDVESFQILDPII
jgi:adenine deaminase